MNLLLDKMKILYRSGGNHNYYHKCMYIVDYYFSPLNSKTAITRLRSIIFQMHEPSIRQRESTSVVRLIFRINPAILIPVDKKKGLNFKYMYLSCTMHILIYSVFHLNDHRWTTGK